MYTYTHAHVCAPGYPFVVGVSRRDRPYSMSDMYIVCVCETGAKRH